MLWTWGGHTVFTIGGAPVSLFGLVMTLFGSWWLSARLEDGIRQLLIGSRQKVNVGDATIYALTRLIRYCVRFGGTLVGLSWLGLNLQSSRR